MVEKERTKSRNSWKESCDALDEVLFDKKELQFFCNVFNAI